MELKNMRLPEFKALGSNCGLRSYSLKRKAKLVALLKNPGSVL